MSICVKTRQLGVAEIINPWFPYINVLVMVMQRNAFSKSPKDSKAVVITLDFGQNLALCLQAWRPHSPSGEYRKHHTTPRLATPRCDDP